MWVAARRYKATSGLVILALTPLILVVGQGVNGPVLANWAVLYLVPGRFLPRFGLPGTPGLR